MSTTTNAASREAGPGTASPGQLVLLGAVGRRVWPEVAMLLAALLWWPVGFWGLMSWLHLPLRVLDGDVLFLGATAAAASVSLLVRAPWPRFAIVVVLSALGWLLDAPAGDEHPHERAVLAVILAASAFVGIVLGARGSKGPLAAASVVVVVAGLSPATWPEQAAVAAALAMPFAVATWQRVAPTVLSIVRLVLTWLAFALLGRALQYSWERVRPGTDDRTFRDQARLVADQSWHFVGAQWWTHSEAALRALVPWLWLTAAVAALLIVVRAVAARRRSGAKARSATQPR